MGNSSASAGLDIVDRVVHSVLVVIMLVGIGGFVGCHRNDDERESDSDVATVTRSQGLILQTDSNVGTVRVDSTVSSGGVAMHVARLWTPEGRSGMSPSLALSYQSAGEGDGHIGVGWSLSGGMSMIHRCAKRSRRHARPEAISFVNAESEQYCLDGQPLVLVDGTNGVAGAEYRTEPDTFSKVVIDEVSGGVPMKFTVFTHDGRIHSYGTPVTGGAPEDESLLVIKGNRDQWELARNANRDDGKVVNSPSDAAVYGWLRGSVRDRFAFPNHMWFKYGHPPDRANPGKAQEPLLEAIEYVDVSGFRTRQVRFEYGLLSDPDAERHEYIAGMPFKTTKRLESIDMRVAAPGSQTLRSVKQYKLSHEISPSTKRLRLSSIQECDGNAALVSGRTVVCKKATVFTYSDDSNSFSPMIAGPAIADLRQPVDAEYWGIQVADINADGKDDIVYRATPPAGGPRRWYYRGGGAGAGGAFGPAIDLNLLANDEPGDAVIADFARPDGARGIDGAPDIAIPAGPNIYAYYRNDGHGNFGHISTETAEEVAANQKGIQIADLSGKGHVTVLRPIASGGNWGYRFFTGTAMTAISGPMGCLWNQDFDQAGWNGQATDIDGDGAADFLTIRAGATDYLSRMLQLRVPAPAPVQGVPPPGEGEPDQVWDYDETNLLASKAGDLVKHLFFDFNGDHLPDAFRLRQGQDTPRLLINSGNGFTTPEPARGRSGAGAVQLLSATAGNVELGSTTAARDLIDPGVRTLDFDGDGKQDLLLVDSGIKRDSAAAPTEDKRANMTVLVSRTGHFQVITTSIPVGAPADGPTAVRPAWSLIHNYRQTQLVDANGDGLTDVLAVSPADGQLRLFLRQGQKADLLVGVRDGMGAKTAVAYLPMVDPAVYRPGLACNVPKVCAKRGPWLVRSLKIDNGVLDGQNEYLYEYEGSRIDVEGGGGLGFAKWSRTDLATSTTIEERFDQDTTAAVPSLTEGEPDVPIFWKVGLPVLRIIRTTDPAFIRESTTDLGYEFVATNGRRSYYPRPVTMGTSETEESPPGDLPRTLGVRTRSFRYEPAFDDFGILSGVKSTHSVDAGFFEDEWSAKYQNDAAAWLLGLTTETTVRSKVAGQPEVVRKTAFQPDPNSGALNSLEIEPDDLTHDLYLFEEFVRNVYGQLWIHRRTDRLGNLRTQIIQYDDQSVHARTHTNALNQVTTFDADPGLGVLNSVTDPNNATTTFGYDAFGRLRRVSFPGGGGTTISYARVPDPSSTAEDPRDQVKITSIRDGGGEVRSFVDRVDHEVRRERRNLDASLSYVSLFYNDLGQPSGISRPALLGQPLGALTSLSYDELGRLTTQERPEESTDRSGSPATSATTSFSYQKLVATITDPFGRPTRLSEDGLGRVIKSESRNDDGQWLATEYSYGPFGVLRDVVRRNGARTQSRTTTLAYDTLGRPTTVTDPDTGARAFKHNAFGEVREQTDAAGAVTTFTRDPLGRVTGKVDKDGTTTLTWDTAVNGKGRLAETNSASGVRRQFFYDAFGRMHREIWTVSGQAFQLDYAYDSHGRLQKVSYPSSTGFTRLIVNNTYDGDSGELSQVYKDGTATVYWTLNTTAADGQIKQETFGNAVRTDYGYSGITGRIQSIRSTKGTTTLRDWSYGYWSDGNLRQKSDLRASRHERFEYDELDRIKRWLAADSAGDAMSGGWAVNYTIDDFGNLTRRHFVAGSTTGGTSQDLGFSVFPGTNRVQTSPWGSYSYDANGNQTGRPDGETVSYTAFDLPKQITGPRAASFLYDGFGLRARKQKDSANNTVYVGGVYERRVTGSTIDHVFYVVARGRVVAQVMRRQGGTESVQYLHVDRLGSVDAVTDAAGVVVEQTRRDPFGNKVTNFNQPTLPSTVSPGSNRVRLGFTGHEQDDELGLINMRGRMYDPRLGRFLTTDPVVQRPFLGASFNRYSYVFNNPTRYRDPTGLEADSCDIDPAVNQCGPKGPPPKPTDNPPDGYVWEFHDGEWRQVPIDGDIRVVHPLGPDLTNSANSGTGVETGPAPSSGGDASGGGPPMTSSQPPPPPGPGTDEPPQVMTPAAQGPKKPTPLPVMASTTLVAPRMAEGLKLPPFVARLVERLGPALVAKLGAAGAYFAIAAAGVSAGFAIAMYEDDIIAWLKGFAGGLQSKAEGVPVPERDATGRIHCDLPDYVPSSWTGEDLRVASSELAESIARRKEEQERFGEDAAHRERIRQEERLKKQVDRAIGDRGSPNE